MVVFTHSLAGHLRIGCELMSKELCAMARKLLSRDDLKGKGISYSDAQIYRKIKDGSFPRPIRLGANRVAWPENEIDDWINARIAERTAPVPEPEPA